MPPKKTKKKTAKKKPTVAKNATVSKKEMVKKDAPKPPAIIPAPDGMDHLWKHKEVREKWDRIHPRHQAVFIEWLANGFNGFRAVLKIYLYDEEAQYNTAMVKASQILRSDNVMAIRRYIVANPRREVEKAKQVFIDAMDSPDTKIAMQAAKNHLDYMDKLTGEESEKPDDKPGGDTYIQNNITILNNSIQHIQHLFNHKPKE